MKRCGMLKGCVRHASRASGAPASFLHLTFGYHASGRTGRITIYEVTASDCLADSRHRKSHVETALCLSMGGLCKCGEFVRNTPFLMKYRACVYPCARVRTYQYHRLRHTAHAAPRSLAAFSPGTPPPAHTARPRARAMAHAASAQSHQPDPTVSCALGSVCAQPQCSDPTPPRRAAALIHVATRDRPQPATRVCRLNPVSRVDAPSLTDPHPRLLPPSPRASRGASSVPPCSAEAPCEQRPA